jgi:hypothetical protein
MIIVMVDCIAEFDDGKSEQSKRVRGRKPTIKKMPG